MPSGVYTRTDKHRAALKGSHKGVVNGGTFKKGQKPWNDGLTKETDERVAKAAKNTKLAQSLMSKESKSKRSKKAAKTRKDRGHDKQSKESREKAVKSRRENNKIWNSEETCQKISKTLLHHTVTEETREKIRKNTKIGMQNMSEDKKVEMNKNLCIALSKVTNKKRYKQSTETCRKKRIKSVERFLESGYALCLGLNEKELLDKQELIDKIPIYRQYYVYQLGYIADGYNPFVNTVYEVYEKVHKKKVEKDLQRQKEIEECLKCKFVIIWDETH